MSQAKQGDTVRVHYTGKLKDEDGKVFDSSRQDGHMVAAVVADVSESTVTIDANHPLAGKDLVFDTVIIGAMVIAPLLGPNVALALATTLGDVGLICRSLKANALGLFTAFVLPLLLGLIFSVDPPVPVIAL